MNNDQLWKLINERIGTLETVNNEELSDIKATLTLFDERIKNLQKVVYWIMGSAGGVLLTIITTITVKLILN